MSFADSPATSSLNFTKKTLERAERSLVCSPFHFTLFDAMRRDRVAMGAITGQDGVNNGYAKYPISELTADNALAWLIQVGVLRREVDGQGITDSFRLTPLGRKLVEKYEGENWRDSTLRDRVTDAMTRWLRLPF
jgi:hypothetical protein